MDINFNGKEITLAFGLRTLVEIDKELGFEIEGASLGEGLEMLAPKLDTGNIVALSKIIKAAASHDKKGPKSHEDLEQILNNIAENESFKVFGEQIVEELGKQPMTRDLVKEYLTDPDQTETENEG